MYINSFSSKNITRTATKVNFNGNKGNDGKNTLSCVASVLIPGTGQMINGEPFKGLSLLGITFTLATVYLSKTVKNTTLSLMAGIGSLALHLYSIMDAYKHKSKE